MTWPFLDLLSEPQRDLLLSYALCFLAGVLLTWIVLGRVYRRRLARAVRRAGQDQADTGAGTLSLVHTDEATADALEVIVMAGRGLGTGYAADPPASARFGAAGYRPRAGSAEGGVRGGGRTVGRPEPALVDAVTSAPTEQGSDAGAGHTPEPPADPADAPQSAVVPRPPGDEPGSVGPDEAAAHVAEAAAHVAEVQPLHAEQPEHADVPEADRPAAHVAAQPASTEAASSQAVAAEAAAPKAAAPEAASTEAASPEAAAPEASAVEEGPYGPGSVSPLPDGSSPLRDHTIKGNLNSKYYHTTASPFYQRTKANVYFRSTEDAERSGFMAWNRRRRRG